MCARMRVRVHVCVRTHASVCTCVCGKGDMQSIDEEDVEELRVCAHVHVCTCPPLHTQSHALHALLHSHTFSHSPRMSRFPLRTLLHSPPPPHTHTHLLPQPKDVKMEDAQAATPAANGDQPAAAGAEDVAGPAPMDTDAAAAAAAASAAEAKTEKKKRVKKQDVPFASSQVCVFFDGRLSLSECVCVGGGCLYRDRRCRCGS